MEELKKKIWSKKNNIILSKINKETNYHWINQ